MRVYFFDTSALVKRYVPESGTLWVRAQTRLNAEARVFVARNTEVEVASAVMRRAREKRFTMADADHILTLFAKHMVQQYLVVELSPDVTKLGVQFTKGHALRAYDAVQLASAVLVKQSMVGHIDLPLHFVASDKRLLAAAEAEGLIRIDPAAP